MNTRRKHTAIGALLLCLGIASMHGVTAEERAEERAQESREQQRQAVTIDRRAVTAFNAIELAGPFRVIVNEGAPRLELSGEPKQLAEIESEVRGGTLIVRHTDIKVRGPGSATVNLVRDGSGGAGGRADESVPVERGGRRQAD